MMYSIATQCYLFLFLASSSHLGIQAGAKIMGQDHECGPYINIYIQAVSRSQVSIN